MRSLEGVNALFNWKERVFNECEMKFIKTAGKKESHE